MLARGFVSPGVYSGFLDLELRKTQADLLTCLSRHDWLIFLTLATKTCFIKFKWSRWHLNFVLYFSYANRPRLKLLYRFYIFYIIMLKRWGSFSRMRRSLRKFDWPVCWFSLGLIWRKYFLSLYTEQFAFHKICINCVKIGISGKLDSMLRTFLEIMIFKFSTVLVLFASLVKLLWFFEFASVHNSCKSFECGELLSILEHVWEESIAICANMKNSTFFFHISIQTVCWYKIVCSHYLLCVLRKFVEDVDWCNKNCSKL